MKRLLPRFFWILYSMVPILSARLFAQTYSYGDPTPAEQQYLEYINRARMDPRGEARRLINESDPDVRFAYQFFGVSFEILSNQFSHVPAVPPLAMNRKLVASARAHSLDMFTHRRQTHMGSDGRSLSARLDAQGYPWATYGENIHTMSMSTVYGHCSFEVDWGYSIGGMQTPPGHRITIHNKYFREVGIGIVDGVAPRIGPQVVTQDFADQFGSLPFITGVAYVDADRNGFYSMGEGLDGLQVSVGTNRTSTATAGGYGLQVGDGTYYVTFAAGGYEIKRLMVSVINHQNAKVDLVLTPELKILNVSRSGVLVSAFGIDARSCHLERADFADGPWFFTRPTSPATRHFLTAPVPSHGFYRVSQQAKAK